MVVFLSKFVKLLVVCMLLTNCGFQLAKSTILIGNAESLRLANIENTSRSPNIDFLLEKELQKKFARYTFYTKNNIAELELFITITAGGFSVEKKEQVSKDFYKHSYSIKAKLFLNDLRNEQPSKTKKEFMQISFLNWRVEIIDDAIKKNLQNQAITELAEQIFFFVTQ